MKWFVLLGVIIFVLISILFFLWFKKKKYTRERYAFFATSLIFAYSMTVLTHIFIDVSLFQIVIMLYNQLPFENMVIPGTSWSDKAWSIFFLITLSTFVYLMFESWGREGKVSKLDSGMSDVREELGFLHAAIIGMNPSKIETVDRSVLEKISNKTNFELCFLDQERDWPSEAQELLNMYAYQYRIEDKEWYKDKSCFFSKYANKPLLVICSQTIPADEFVLERIGFFAELSKEKTIKVILAIKEFDGSERNKTLKGYKVEIFSKEFLLNNLVDFSEYNYSLNKQFFESEVSEGDVVRLQDIYVESEGVLTDLTNHGEQHKKVESVEAYLINWAESKKSEEQIVLLGDYGQGKSVLSLRFANELVDSEIKRQPIIIELRGKSPRNMPMGELVAAWAYRFNYNVKALLKLLQEGKLVVILEGFDELDMVGDRLRRLEHFKKLWEFARYKKSKVVITGRPNLFLNNEEAKNYLQLNNGESSTFHVKALKLEPFNRERIKLALRSAPDKISKSILEQYDSTGKGVGFADLISRPSTLFQTSIIWDGLDKSKLNSSKIINSFIEHAYKRQAQKLLSISGTDLEAPVLTVQERAYFMLGISVGMVENGGYSNQISGRELEGIVFRLFISIPLCCSNDHHSCRLGLHERLQDNAFESVYNDVRTAGILVRDLASVDSFKFAHKSFLESLFASFVKNKITSDNQDQKLITNTIEKALSISNVYSLKFSDEVIGHVTENIVNQGQAFGDREALSLMTVLSSKAPALDFVFFKSKFKLTIWLMFTMLLALLCTYFYIVLETETKTESVSSMWSQAVLFIMLFCNFYYVGMVYSFRFARRLKAAVEIWCRACEVQGYDVKNEKVLSQFFMDRCHLDIAKLNSFEIIISFINSKFLRKQVSSD